MAHPFSLRGPPCPESDDPLKISHLTLNPRLGLNSHNTATRMSSKGLREVSECQTMGPREWTEKESSRRAWLADGGREVDFEKAWPELRNERRRRRIFGQ